MSLAEIDLRSLQQRYPLTTAHFLQMPQGRESLAHVQSLDRRWASLIRGEERTALVHHGALPPTDADFDVVVAGGSLGLLAALSLARRGWRVTGVDISAAALALAHDQLAAAGLLDRAALIEADLDGWRPAAGCCDLLTCFHFLDRRLWPSLRAAVRPRGLLCLSTYHTGRLVERPHTNPDHLLHPGELSALVQGWGWRLLAAQVDAQQEAVLGQRP